MRFSKNTAKLSTRLWAAASALVVIVVLIIVLVTQSSISKVAVPLVVGQSQSHALAQLKKDGFTYLVEEVHRSTATPPRSGTVISQDPRGGSQIDKGHSVTIVVYTP